MDITELRKQIDTTDSALLHLFLERMKTAENIAAYKKEHGMAVFNQERETDILSSVREKAREYGDYASVFFKELMTLSKNRQYEITDGRTGLLGRHLSHSYSREIQSEFGIKGYRMFECEPENVAEFVKSGHFRGLNVTIPYKKTVLPLCDTLSDEAKDIDCVNTLVFSPDGKIHGHNTDACGFLYAVRHSGIEVSGKKVLVFGSGGASLAVKHALGKIGAREIVTVSRSGENNYSNLYLHRDAQIIVNATPVGMYPSPDEKITDLSKFPSVSGVFDLIYNPLRTDLLLQAQSLSIPCVNGLSMLVAQAKHSAELFTGTQIPDAETERVLRLMKNRTRNIVLIGMPGSGKSTIGTLLAEMTGRAVYDTDAAITEMKGKSIPEILEREGEKAFREYEKQALKRVGELTGKIIVTGGGAVLSEENLAPLQRNGRVYYIERSVQKLATSGRPLSVKNSLDEMYAQRKPLYESVCDTHTDNNGDSPLNAAVRILEDFYEA